MSGMWDEEEEEEYEYSGYRGRGGSLQDSLLATAQRFEAQKAEELAGLRSEIRRHRGLFDAEASKLRKERENTLRLETTVRETNAKVEFERARADGLQAQLARHKAEWLGVCLLLAELRTALTPEKEQLKKKTTVGSRLRSLTANGEADAEGEGANGGGAEVEPEGEDAADGESAGSEAAPPAAATPSPGTPTKSDSGTPTPADADADAHDELVPVSADDGGKLVAGAAAQSGSAVAAAAAAAAAAALLSSLPPMTGEAELLSACGEGRQRGVETGLCPSGLGDVMHARSEAVLAEGLERSVEGGHTRVVKQLVEAGAEAHGSEVLHVAIRSGHVGLLSYLVGTLEVSVNTRDSSGASPLHVAADANEPKAAQFLLRNSAFVDAVDSSGRTALQVAEARRWKEMQRVLRDPSLLFWNRAARANKLYKQAEYEPACEGYAAAEEEMRRMASPPPPQNVATFYFNFGRAAQSFGQLSRAIGLFDKVLESSPKHERALDHRADCHQALSDLDSALADLTELTALHGGAADEAQRKGWARRMAEAKMELGLAPREVLGLHATADDVAVRKAYKQACLAHHPDKHAASSDDVRARAKHRFGRIKAAYEKLSKAAGAGAREWQWQRTGSGAYRTG